MVQWSRIHLPMQEMWVQSLGRDDLLEEEMATHSSILAWEISWEDEVIGKGIEPLTTSLPKG